MSYPLREHKINTVYNVFSRCINLSNLLKDSAVKDLFMITLREAQEKYNFSLLAFSIENNKINLVIKTKTEKDNISIIMKYIKGVFAKRYNSSIGRSGPVWNERFYSEIVSNDRHDYMNYNIYRISNPTCMNLKYLKNYSSNMFYLKEAQSDNIFNITIEFAESYMSLGSTKSERIKKFKKFKNSC